MATGGDSVDAEHSALCDICDEDGQQAIADHYCVVCDQHLCDNCKNVHSKVRATKSHEVVRIDEISHPISLSLDSESTELPVCKAHGNEIKYFCANDMVEICGTCKLIKHKTCQNIMEIKKAAVDMFSEHHGKKILESIKGLLCRFLLHQKELKNNRSKLEQDKNSAVENIKDTRRSIDSYLDKIETAAYEELQSVFQVNVEHLQDQMHVCESSVSSLQKQASSMEIAMSVGEKEQEFITINTVMKEVMSYCKLLQDILEDPCDINMSYQQNDNIALLNEHLKSLGKVSVSKSLAPSDTVAIYTGEIKVNTETDNVKANINSYEALADGRHLLVDSKNKKLKLFDSNKQLLSELVLAGAPSTTVLLTETEAIISLPTMRALQYVRINEGLEQIETRSVCYKPGPMAKRGADIVAFADKNTIKLIDRNGKMKRTIYKDGSLFSRPGTLALSLDCQTVCVVDLFKGCIGLSMDGNVVFKHDDQKVKCYGGLVVGDDCLFIGVNQGDRLRARRLNLNGTAEVVDIGVGAPLKLRGNTLFVSKSGHDKEDCFGMFYFLLR